MAITRPVDKMGRVVIPKEMRDQLGVKSDSDKFEISVEGNQIVLRKFKPVCVFCNQLADSVKYQGQTICYECLEKLNQLKSEQMQKNEENP